MEKENNELDSKSSEFNLKIKSWVRVAAFVVGIPIAVYPYFAGYFFKTNQIEINFEKVKIVETRVEKLENRVDCNEKEIVKTNAQTTFYKEAIDEIKNDLKDIKKILMDKK